VQRAIGVQALSDFHQAARSGENGEEDGLEFVVGSVAEGLLWDVDLLGNGFPDLSHSQDEADRCQKGSW